MRNISFSNSDSNNKISKNIKFFIEQIQKLQNDTHSKEIAAYLEEVKNIALNPHLPQSTAYSLFSASMQAEYSRYDTYCKKLQVNGSKDGRPRTKTMPQIADNQLVYHTKQNGFTQPKTFTPIRENASSNILLYKYNNKSILNTQQSCHSQKYFPKMTKSSHIYNTKFKQTPKALKNTAQRIRSIFYYFFRDIKRDPFFEAAWTKYMTFNCAQPMHKSNNMTFGFGLKADFEAWVKAIQERACLP